MALDLPVSRELQAVVAGAQVEVEVREVGTVPPPQVECFLRGGPKLERAGERRVGVPQANEVEEIAHERLADGLVHFSARVVVAVYVAAHVSTPEQLHVVVARKQSDVCR